MGIKKYSLYLSLSTNLFLFYFHFIKDDPEVGSKTLHSSVYDDVCPLHSLTTEISFFFYHLFFKVNLLILQESRPPHRIVQLLFHKYISILKTYDNGQTI